ncbi:hypothetical protein H8959_004498 [Pygathrix nigripes]
MTTQVERAECGASADALTIASGHGGDSDLDLYALVDNEGSVEEHLVGSRSPSCRTTAQVKPCNPSGDLTPGPAQPRNDQQAGPETPPAQGHLHLTPLAGSDWHGVEGARVVPGSLKGLLAAGVCIDGEAGHLEAAGEKRKCGVPWTEG